MDIGRKLVELEARLARMESSPRLSHASLDDTSLSVRDATGNLRGLLGVQSDGTTAVNIVNGPPPPTPSDPVVASVLGGVTVSWDGTFTGGAVLPLDWSRIEVHASTTAVYEPVPGTLQDTIETAQGATVVVPCDTGVYVRLLARNTSGTASPASATIGPYGPVPVVASDILDGIVTEVKLANDAVTAAKIASGAVGSTELADAAVHAQQLADAAVEVAKIADSAVTGPAIATDAVTAGKIAANAVTTAKLNAGAVVAAKVAAGAITTDKLTVTGGANILTDPSFAGAYTASLVAGSTFATQDFTAGNGTLDSLKIDATSVSAAFRSVALTSVATLPGEKWYLAVDYWVSADWVGTELSIHARWETITGAVISYSKAVTTTPVREAWTRIEATVTAPATTYRLVPRVESGSATAGFVRFDNAVVRPVLGGTQIQDGAVTTEKIIAGAILAGQIAAGAVLTDKLAAEAVTAAKIAALTITAGQIAANAITVGKLAAGAVDATAIAADAITGKTITGGTITGSLLQTAASGERITLNEGGANKVLVYNSAGTAIGELSARGLLVAGTSGAVLWLNPEAALPTLRFDNASGTNSAYVQMAEVSPGDANLQLISGTFTADTFTDRVWRMYMGSDFALIERIRRSSATAHRGGRVNMRADFAEIGYMNSAVAADAGYHYYQPGLVTTMGRSVIQPAAAGSDSVLQANAATGHTGNLLRLSVNGTDKATVDKDGNASVANLTVAGIGQVQTKSRTTDATKTSTATLTADTQITFTVAANAVYTIQGMIKYSGPGDFQMSWSVPSGATGEWVGLGNGTTVVSGTGSGGTQLDIITSAGYTVRTESTDIAAARTYGGITTTTFGIHVNGLVRIGATGGTLALTWAQGASNATATTLYTNSHIRLERTA